MGTAQRTAGPEHIELFNYPSSSQPPSQPDWQGWGAVSESGEPELQDHERARTPHETAASAEFEKRLAEETRRSFEAGRERGRQEGLQTEREVHATAQKAAEQHRLRRHAEIVETFAQERDRYLQAVEQEVVKLALAVAARILRREAQMDPLLLTGAVRVALGQLSGSTEVLLRVPAGEIELWTEAISLIPNLALKPTVIAGEGMRLGDCVVETSMGSVDLGIRSQLGEIERGFFDRAGSVAAVPASRIPSVTEANQ
jgi:flagellar assembly protein FliH